jgi:Heavy-metal resistance
MFKPLIPTSTSEPIRPGYLLLFGVIGGFAVATITFFVIHFFGTSELREMAKTPNGELEWLRREFHLSDAQFQKIETLQATYAPVCDAMCQRIMEANAKLDRLMSENSELTPDVQAAMKEAGLVQEDCHQQMLAHIYRVSAQMNPAEGQRYLRMMKSRVIQPALSSDTAVKATTE